MIPFRCAALIVLLGILPASVEAAVSHQRLRPDPVVPTRLPDGKRVPANWPAFPVGSAPVLLRPADSIPPGPGWLRLTTAIDDRELRHVEVRLGADGRTLGVLDLRYAHAIETFQLPLDAGTVSDVAKHGVTLRTLGQGSSLWFFSIPDAAQRSPALPVEFQPHLLAVSGTPDRRQEFLRRMASLASLQAFGWMEGCVLDGLHDLAGARDGARFYRAAIEHWQVFSPTPGLLVYESPRSAPVNDRVYGIEGGLPFADLARREPKSPLIDLFLNFCRRNPRTDGAIQDGDTLSAEGSYTVGYPLATIAAARGDRALGSTAMTQLRLRRDRLWHDGAIWLRHTDAGNHTFRAWARGVAWHALGVARSIPPLRKLGFDTTELEVELRRIAAWVMPLQRSDGLWSCYIEDRADGIPDTSGSAGIAAALALGHRHGALPPTAANAARAALLSVERYLTPDGLLDGAAQSNRGGEALQRSDYRVLSQMGMGLLAQLIAALEAP